MSRLFFLVVSFWKPDKKFSLLPFSFSLLFFVGCATTPSVSQNVLAQLSKQPSISSVLFPLGNVYYVPRGEAAVAGLFGSYGHSPKTAKQGHEYMMKNNIKDPALAVIEYFSVGLVAAYGLKNFNTKPTPRDEYIEHVYENPRQLRPEVSTRFAFGFRTNLINLGGGLERSLQYTLSAGLFDIEKNETVWKTVCFHSIKVKKDVEQDETAIKPKFLEIAKGCAEDLLRIVGGEKHDTATQAVARSHNQKVSELKGP